jgi:hypothetical protein
MRYHKLNSITLESIKGKYTIDNEQTSKINC